MPRKPSATDSQTGQPTADKTRGGHSTFLGLGTNQGNRQALLEEAIRLIGLRAGQVTRRSSVIETEPWGFVSENKFLNMVVKVETTLTPQQLLETTQQIERDMGRTQKSRNNSKETPVYHDRPIDIDILLYDDLHINTPRLVIPHPLMQQRNFVMQPLNEIT